MSRAILRISATVFAEALSMVGELAKAEGLIGEVHFPGVWNNWGDSPEKAGHIRPSDATKATLVDDQYVLEVNDLQRGLHGLKPVVLLTEPDQEGFCSARWIECPEKGYGGFKPDPKRGNWMFFVH